MDLGVIPDARAPDADARVEGKVWCLSCDGEIPYRMEKVEFLGNPVRASFFCLDCGRPVHPEALDRKAALRLRAERRRLRAGVGISFTLMLLLPLLILALVLFLIWRAF